MTSALSSAADSLSSLLRQSTVNDHDELLKAADASLRKSKNDIEAQHVKLVALLKLDRFEDALKVLEEGGDRLKERARLEWAYALYKGGNPAKAAEVAGQGSERGFRHIEAQASYRNENFKRAHQLYGQLVSGGSQISNEDMDIKINSGAVDAQLEWARQGDLVQKKKPGREDLEAFETAYNAACGSIARDELGQAEILLKRAKDLCNALEDLSEAERQAELLPITVQQIYVLTRQGKAEEAKAVASSIKPSDLPDAATRHIAEINTTAAAPQTSNPYLSHRLLHKSPDSLKPDRPFDYQSDIMKRNNYALDLLSEKYAGAAHSTAAAISSKQSPTVDSAVTSLSVVNAAAHARNQTGKEALKLVQAQLEKRPNDVGLILVIVQLYILTGNHASAIALMESFFARLQQSGSSSDLEVRYAPGLVGTLVSLYSARSQSAHARTELARAAKYWQQRSRDATDVPSQRSLGHLYKAAGVSLLESSKPEDLDLARNIFSELSQQDPEDRYASAGLVAALAATSPSSIQSPGLSSLTPVERLVAGINISALEEAGIAKPATSATPVTSVKRSAPAAPPKAKNIRPSRMPKDYDASKKPDPERWLPMRDRTYYKPKGRKGKQKQAMLMQGGVVVEREDSASRPGTPAGGEVKSGGGQQQKNKKKKGKGGKW